MLHWVDRRDNPERYVHEDEKSNKNMPRSHVDKKTLAHARSMASISEGDVELGILGEGKGAGTGERTGGVPARPGKTLRRASDGQAKLVSETKRVSLLVSGP